MFLCRNPGITDGHDCDFLLLQYIVAMHTFK